MKKIGSDSLVLITVKQGDQINKRFDEIETLNKTLKDSLIHMNDSTFRLKTKVDSLKEVNNRYYFIYTENRRMYMEREREFRKENKRHTVRYLILAVVILFQTIVVR